MCWHTASTLRDFNYFFFLQVEANTQRSVSEATPASTSLLHRDYGKEEAFILLTLPTGVAPSGVMREGNHTSGLATRGWQRI